MIEGIESEFPKKKKIYWNFREDALEEAKDLQQDRPRMEWMWKEAAAV